MSVHQSVHQVVIGGMSSAVGASSGPIAGSLDVPGELAWRNRGACNGLDPAIFYPDNEDKADVAVAICAECAVRAVCLEYALTRREKEGIWGGATERERRRLVRQRRRIA